jgi:hypothetical protein
LDICSPTTQYDVASTLKAVEMMDLLDNCYVSTPFDPTSTPKITDSDGLDFACCWIYALL